MTSEHHEAVRRLVEVESMYNGPGLLRPSDGCPIGWSPNALAPVFHGARDLDTADGAPAPLRIFFPSLMEAPDGTVFDARVLEGCGRFPLVILLHGHCQFDLMEHYKEWWELPRRLAKSGYVVIVPQVPSIGHVSGESHPALKTLADLLSWARGEWDNRSVLMPSPATAVLGHSYGGLLAGRFAATNSSELAAYASISAGWEHEGLDPQEVLPGLQLPKLFLEASQDHTAILSPGLWESLSHPKHRATFSRANHWDYLPSGPDGCRGQSSCGEFPGAPFDVTLMFLSKYLPPERSPDLPDLIPDSLRPPTPLDLSPAQQFYANSGADSHSTAPWLSAMDRLGQDLECGVTLDWRTARTRIVPHVMFVDRQTAVRTLERSDLVPKFTTPGGNSSWVRSQSPRPGSRANAGDTVTMGLANGPIP
jgi:pimeloyl-ACP methyl ester carboxylesterase